MISLFFCDSKLPQRYIIPDYVAPHEKKREAVRFNIRMKMYLASGIVFESPLDAAERKRIPNKHAKVANKVTRQNADEISQYVKENTKINVAL